MIALEHIVALAIQNRAALDQLGEALSSDLVVANPFYRAIVQFADRFVLERNVLPATGDWQVWLEGMTDGVTKEGTREALGHLLATPLEQYDPTFFATTMLEVLKKTAAEVARSRLLELSDVKPETFLLLAEKISAIHAGNIQGLATLRDVDTWARPYREDELVPTGFPTFDRWVGGWGKELWIVFADSGVGKSMLLQNFAANAALRNKTVLHITLELGLRSQIHRYYRQIAQITRPDWSDEIDTVKARMRHWLRYVRGDIVLLEYPAYEFSTTDLERVIPRVARVLGRAIDVLVVDYLDLVALPATGMKSQGRGYEDLGRITHLVRGLCQKFDLTVLTASQSVRRPANKGRLTQQDMGDSYNKVRAADGLISLVQTDEEAEVMQGRIGLVKLRDSGGRNAEVPLYINRELAVIQELDHPNTRELRTRLGHILLGTPGGPTTLSSTP